MSMLEGVGAATILSYSEQQVTAAPLPEISTPLSSFALLTCQTNLNWRAHQHSVPTRCQFQQVAAGVDEFCHVHVDLSQ
jgi:hypothetical protein